MYDGQGHALALPRAVPATERVPLVVVGRGKTLRLKNVWVANAGSLAGVLALGPGARLVAEADDGVEMDEYDLELADLGIYEGRRAPRWGWGGGRRAVLSVGGFLVAVRCVRRLNLTNPNLIFST